MQKQASITEQILPLPKGGGAIQGIGETFTPDMQSGTGNTSLPIALLPGRAGFAPSVGLSYSSGMGNGPFGLGWALSVPGVMRKTARGVPRYTEQDTFVLSGAEDLVELEWLDQNLESTQNLSQRYWIRYAPRTEGTFARILFHPGTSSTASFWKVQSQEGHTSYYGTPEHSFGAGMAAPGTLHDPDDVKKICEWKLTRTEDTFGNAVIYDWLHVTGTFQHNPFIQLYLSSIRYVDYTVSGDGGPVTRYAAQLHLDWEERPDSFSEWRSSFQQRTTKRCVGLRVLSHHPDEPAALLVRRYVPTYSTAANGVSLLTAFHVESTVGVETERMPATLFGYTSWAPENSATLLPVMGDGLPTQPLGSPSLMLVDLFGRGLPDLVEMNGKLARYWKNRGQGKFAAPRPFTSLPAGINLNEPGVQLLDADADGRLDLMVIRDGLAGYFPMRESEAGWEGSKFVAYRELPSFSVGDPLVRYLDLDGDGIVDALRTGERFECFLQRNDPPALSGQARPQGWSESFTLPRIQDLKSFPNVRFDDPRVRLADMTGDGLQDIVLIQDRRVDYWPNRGWGHFGQRVSLMSSPDLPPNYDPARLLLADVDGDGCADLVYIEPGRVTVWLNKSGNSFAEGRIIRGTPPVTDMSQVQLVDLLGQGTAGLLFDVPTSASAVPRRFFLDLLQGNKPYIMHTTDNQMGARTQVSYRSSVVDLLRDERAGKPWKTSLPFPTLVVASTTSLDLISHVKVSAEYTYHHGYWDPREREFRGFARVETRDTPTDTAQSDHPISVPMLSKSWFHVGPVGDAYGGWDELAWDDEYWSEDPQRLVSLAQHLDLSWSATEKRDALRTLRGSVLRTELYALDESARMDRPYTVSESVTGVRRVHAARTDEKGRYFPAIHFPYAIATRSTEWDRGTDPMIQVQFMGSYDALGHLLSQTSIAVPRGRNPWAAASFSNSEPAPEPYLATHARTTYADTVESVTSYLSGRAAVSTSWEIVADEQMLILSAGDAPSVFEVSVAVEAAFAALSPLPAYLACIGQAATYYDGPAFEGLALGELGTHGIPVRSESLVMTQADLEAAYPDGIPVALTQSAPTWGSEYPTEFASAQAPYLGYTRRENDEGELKAGWWVQGSRLKLDFQTLGEAAHGRMLENKDVLGATSSVSYDAHAYLPLEVTDSLGLTSLAIYDTRLLTPRRMRDPNLNWVEVQYSPLGLVRAQAVMGKLTMSGEDEIWEGDTPDVPRQRFEYDLLAWQEQGQPLWVRTRARKHHVHETDVPLPQRDEELLSVEYSDGFGRVIQARALAEDVRFGDATFGDAGLSPDMTLTLTPALGVPRGSGEPDRVVVNGYKRYDNKGRVIEQWEPFFDNGWEWRPEYESNDPTQDTDPVATLAMQGARSRIFHDARGRVYRTQHPDGSEERVVFGVPGSVASPDLSKVGLDEYEPTPWELYAYDRNDLADFAQLGLDNTPEAAAVPVGHRFTPSSTRVDALGRALEVTERNGANLADWYVTSTTYDIRGNSLTITDALQRVAATQVYDLANRSLRSVSIDAGTSWSLLDARSQPIEARDMRGARTLTLFDVTGRPKQLWCQDKTGAPVRLAQVLLYGDEAGVVSSPEASNHKGKLHTHLDEVGRQVMESYDFQGNLLEKVRHVLDAQLLIDAVESTNTSGNNYEIESYAIDWTPGIGESLVDRQEAVLGIWEYRVSSTFDALGRPKQVTYPLDVDSTRKVLVPTYNRAGALSRLVFDGKVYVEHIAYNARGQKVLYARGSSGEEIDGVMTRYTYDPRTLRLRRLRSEVYSKSTLTGGIVEYAGTGTKHQDYGYAYDLNGNIIAILDHTTLGAAIASTLVVTPDVLGYPYGIPNNVYRRVFGYDAINRLVSAAGMEHVSTSLINPWTSQWTPQTSDPNALRQYVESYTYDPMGNLELMQHTASGHSFSRSINTVETSNRLAELESGTLGVEYVYDVAGNITKEHTARYFEWNAAGRLVCFKAQVTGQQASVVSQYVYDAAMWRTLKVISKSSEHFVTVNIDGFFEHMIKITSSTTAQNNEFSVMLGDSRVALIDLGYLRELEDDYPLIQYTLEDHLGSSNVVLDESSDFINRQEYTPYGECSYGSFEKKRYQYIGCEFDDDTKFYYCHNRYLSRYLFKFLSCDSMGFIDGLNVYKYTNNPINYTDKTGTQSFPTCNRDVQTEACTKNNSEQYCKDLKYVRESSGNNIPTMSTQNEPGIAYDANNPEHNPVLKAQVQAQQLSRILASPFGSMAGAAVLGATGNYNKAAAVGDVTAAAFGPLESVPRGEMIRKKSDPKPQKSEFRLKEAPKQSRRMGVVILNLVPKDKASEDNSKSLLNPEEGMVYAGRNGVKTADVLKQSILDGDTPNIIYVFAHGDKKSGLIEVGPDGSKLLVTEKQLAEKLIDITKGQTKHLNVVFVICNPGVDDFGRIASSVLGPGVTVTAVKSELDVGVIANNNGVGGAIVAVPSKGKPTYVEDAWNTYENGVEIQSINPNVR